MRKNKEIQKSFVLFSINFISSYYDFYFLLWHKKGLGSIIYPTKAIELKENYFLRKL